MELTGKTSEEIKKIIESDEDFKNRDFIEMIIKFHPDKLDEVINVIPLITTNISIVEILKQLLNEHVSYRCENILEFKAWVFILNLCGIDSSNIGFAEKTMGWVNFTIKKI